MSPTIQPSNPQSPLALYPRTTVIETRVKSVSPIGRNAALVRFETQRRDAGGQAQPPHAWVAVIRYRYSGEPMSVEDRFVNPLGFQVLRYRRDAEALPPEPRTARRRRRGRGAGGRRPAGTCVVPAHARPARAAAAAARSRSRDAVRLRLLAALLALGAGRRLAAQVQPTPGSGDPRIQNVLYDADQVVQLQGTPGYPDRRRVRLRRGDRECRGRRQRRLAGDRRTSAATICSSRHLIAGVTTNMTVVTNARTYFFELAPLSAPASMAYTVRFRYPAAAGRPRRRRRRPASRAAIGSAARRRCGRAAIADDGVHTYIEWPRDTLAARGLCAERARARRHWSMAACATGCS